MKTANDLPGDVLGPSYGNCPVQSYGTINGCPYYFRARHDHAVFSVAPPGGDPIDVCCGYALGWRLEWHSFNSGWMGHDDADAIVRACAVLFKAANLYP